MNYLKFFLIISLSYLAISCSSVKENTAGKSNIKLNDLNQNLYKLEADCRVNSELNDQSFSFRAKVHIASNDSVAITINGPFGIILGRLFSDKKSFQFYNILENNVYIGTPSEQNIKKATNLSISMNDFMSLFQGKTPFSASEYSLVSTKGDEQSIFSRVKQSEFADFAVVTNKDPKIVQYQRKAQGDVLILNSSYDLYKEKDNVKIPTSINLSMPTVGGKILIELDDFKVNNAASMPARFSLPSSVNIINLDK